MIIDTKATRKKTKECLYLIKDCIMSLHVYDSNYSQLTIEHLLRSNTLLFTDLIPAFSSSLIKSAVITSSSNNVYKILNDNIEVGDFRSQLLSRFFLSLSSISPDDQSLLYDYCILSIPISTLAIKYNHTNSSLYRRFNNIYYTLAFHLNTLVYKEEE